MQRKHACTPDMIVEMARADARSSHWPCLTPSTVGHCVQARRTMRVVGAILAFAFLGVATATNAAGQKFLAENKGKDGVVTLPSGLQYKVLRSGDGSDHPLVNSPCECHYEGRTVANYPEGPVFDSSYARGQPTTFAPNQVIKGWTEAMQLMVEGDKWEMYIPSDLAYGDHGRPPKIGGGDCLIFTMEILKIKGGKKPKSEL